MGFIKDLEEFHVEWLCSAVQFIDIFVNSAEHLNQRVYLQYEFFLVGLEDYFKVSFRV